MRREERQIHDSNLMEKIFNDAKLIHVGMVDDGMPYVVCMNFGYKDNVVYIHGAKVGRKIDILRKNNNVCIQIETEYQIKEGDVACEFTANYLSAVGFGKASFIEDIEQKKEALDIMMHKYTGRTGHEFNQRSLEAVCVIKIELSEVTGKMSK